MSIHAAQARLLKVSGSIITVAITGSVRQMGSVAGIWLIVMIIGFGKCMELSFRKISRSFYSQYPPFNNLSSAHHYEPAATAPAAVPVATSPFTSPLISPPYDNSPA